MKQELSQVLTKGSYAVDDTLQLTVGRHGYFLNLATDQIGTVLSLYGEWAEPETRLLTALVNAGDVVFDIGAHVGTQTVPLARKVGPSGLVVAFEPQRRLHQILSANIALNGLSNVICLNAAAGASEGYVDMPEQNYAQGGNFGAVSLIGTEIRPTAELLSVPVRRIDDFTNGFERCALIKIDVEGMEEPVLRGASSLINRTRPFIYSEAASPHNFNLLKQVAVEHGYRMHWHCFAGYNVLNFFGNLENRTGTGGDANVLLIPEERSVIFDGPIAERFEDIYVLYKGVIGGGPE